MKSIAPSSLDSRLPTDTGMTNAQHYTAPSVSYRVQGHYPTRQQTTPRISVREILKMPKGMHPKPNQHCWTCRDLNREAMLCEMSVLISELVNLALRMHSE